MESAPRVLERPPNNLPLELSSFVGREKELAEVKRSLRDTRLLTFTGSGGCGKTRLALAAASEVMEDFEDGVWMVDLAPLADPSHVSQTVASTLGVREQPGRSLIETLSDYLRPKNVSLVLDNCEHLIEASATLAKALLRSCPDLRLLATSREALGITGEVAWLVPSLSLPDLRHLPAVESLPRYESARLFLERAAAVRPTFALTELGFLAVAWRDQGDHERAKRLAERGLALSREVGERQAISVALNTLATLAQAERDHERARDLFEEGLSVSAELGNESDVDHCLEGLASIAGAEGSLVRAARLWGAAEALLEEIEVGVHTYVFDRSLHQSQVAAARTQLEEAEWTAAWDEGRAMTSEQAIEYALEQKAASRHGGIPRWAQHQ